jgi:hypothetical protein
VKRVDKQRAALLKATKLFRGFRLRAPRSVKGVRIVLPAAVIVMGELRAVEYDMPRGNRKVLYRHEFARGSRPELAAGPGRCELVLIGGNYRVTHRGIVDLTPAGRERDD